MRSDGDGPEIDRIFAENRVIKWETHVMADSLVYVIEYMDGDGAGTRVREYTCEYMHDTSGHTPAVAIRATDDDSAIRKFASHVRSGYAEGDTPESMEDPGAWVLTDDRGIVVCRLPEVDQD